MNNYLGHLTWFSIVTDDKSPVLDVTKEQLLAWFDELELKEEFLPQQTHAIDAFRQATSDATDTYTGDDGMRYRLVVSSRERETQSGAVTRNVFRVSVDDETQRERVASMTFYRPRRRTAGRVQGSEDVKTRLHVKLSGAEREAVRAFVDTCLANYERSRRQLTPHRVRRILRSYLTYLGAVPFGPQDRVYFVPVDGLSVVERLTRLVQRLDGKCSMVHVPLVNTLECLELLRQAVDGDADERARRLLDEVSSWRDAHPGRAPGPLQLRAWRDECGSLQSLVMEYGAAYELAFPNAADSLEELQAAVDQVTQTFLARS